MHARDTCEQHNKEVKLICTETKCDHRMICEDCETLQPVHPSHHATIGWKAKIELKEAADKWQSAQRSRLELIAVYLRSKLQKQTTKILDAIGEQIKLKKRTIYGEWSKFPDTNHYVAQLLNNNFTELNESRFQRIRKCLEVIHQNGNCMESTLQEGDVNCLDKMLRKVIDELMLTSNIFWGHFTMEKKPKTEQIDRTQSNIMVQPPPLKKTGFFEMLGISRMAKSTILDSRYSEKKQEICERRQKLLKQLYKKGKTDVNMCEQNLSEDDFNFVCQQLRDNHEMKTLVLSRNSIYNLHPFQNFRNLVDKNLKTLNLSDNHIQYIRVLAELDLRSLKELKLNNNKIDNISSLAEAKWPKLALLNLASNCFTSIDVVTSMPFPALVELVLDKNKLDSIEPLSRARFSCIKYIRLGTINSNSADVQILDGRVHNKYDFVDHKLKQAICYQ